MFSLVVLVVTGQENLERTQRKPTTIEGDTLATNDDRILIDDALMLLRSKVNRMEFLMVQIEKAFGVSAISMERVDSLYNEFHTQAEEVLEFINTLYEISARVLGYEVEEDTDE